MICFKKKLSTEDSKIYCILMIESIKIDSILKTVLIIITILVYKIVPLFVSNL